MVVNFQSLLPKKTELWHIIKTISPDIILGTETWLSPGVPDAEIFPPEVGYTVFRHDRADKYGGAIVATKNDLVVQEINKQNSVEAVFVKISLASTSLTVGSVYRTPSSTNMDQMNRLIGCLDKLDQNDVLWIGGDLNLPDIDWRQERVTGHQYPIAINEAFIEKTRDIGLTQTNHTPTRGDNILDLFFTNRPNLTTNCWTIPGLSDHDIIITDNNVAASKIIQVPRTVTIWKKANVTAMQEETRIFAGNFIKQTHTNVQRSWDSISEHLKELMKKHVPTKKVSTKFHQPWIQTSLKRLSRQKRRAWAKAKTSNSPVDWEKYEEIKKKTQRENRRAYESHVNTLISEDSNKALWKYIKSRKCDPVGVASLRHENTTHTENVDKANALNRQFCSVFTSENDHDRTPTSSAASDTTINMQEITVTIEGVYKLLSNLNPKKAAGPDDIPARLLQLTAKEIAPALTKLFNMSLNTGEIPIIWKHARVQPIFKKGDRHVASNYRPISLTCICCKLLEHIIRTSITTHLENANILNDAQHGFRKGRSCETQLISVVHDFTSVLDRGGQTDVVLLDFAKAFDKVPHQRLIHKLQEAGINETTVRWIKAFLSERTQVVVVGGEASETGKVSSGVPQGSVLGPTLFLIYINDLPVNIDSNVKLFADDTLLYKNINNVEDCHKLNSDLWKLQQWEQKWLMDFNVSKCQVLRVTNKKSPIMFSYQLHGQTLQEVNSAKYLGIEISSSMKWSTHISHITSKANIQPALLSTET